MAERPELHARWDPEVGFAFQLGDGPIRPVGFAGVLRHIAAAGEVHGDAEAARLLAGLRADLRCQQTGLAADVRECSYGAAMPEVEVDRALVRRERAAR